MTAAGVGHAHSWADVGIARGRLVHGRAIKSPTLIVAYDRTPPRCGDDPHRAALALTSINAIARGRRIVRLSASGL